MAATPRRAENDETPDADTAPVGQAAPRPPAPDDIAAMMAAAEARARESGAERDGARTEKRARLLQHALFGALWGGLGVAAE